MGSNSSLTSPNELEVPAEWARSSRRMGSNVRRMGSNDVKKKAMPNGLANLSFEK